MIEKIFTFVPAWLIILLVIFQAMLGVAAYLILLERKIASWVQDRIGPNRVGPMGLLQPMADGIKMFMKEDYRSSGTDRWLFCLAPALMILVVFVVVLFLQNFVARGGQRCDERSSARRVGKGRTSRAGAFTCAIRNGVGGWKP